MKIIDTRIPDVKIIIPKVFEDNRGYFFESFNQNEFEQAVGYPVTFVQDNHSTSKQGVLRGLHYQVAPHAQGKLVRCIKGEVFDVAVDLRKSSSSYGEWISANLSEHNRQQLWIPPGFAHGFIALSETVDFLYKTTKYYAPQAERCIRWNDETLAISWPSKNPPFLSEKDLAGKSFIDIEAYI